MLPPYLLLMLFPLWLLRALEIVAPSLPSLLLNSSALQVLLHLLLLPLLLLLMPLLLLPLLPLLLLLLLVHEAQRLRATLLLYERHELLLLRVELQD